MAYNEDLILKIAREYMSPGGQVDVEDDLDDGRIYIAAVCAQAVIDAVWVKKLISDEVHADYSEKLGLTPEQRAEIRSVSNTFASKN